MTCFLIGRIFNKLQIIGGVNMGIVEKFKNSLLLKLFLGLVLVIATLAIMLLWGGNDKLPKPSMNSDVLERVQKITTTGGVMKITREEVNYLFSLTSIKNIKKGDITIRDMYVSFGQGEMTIYIPIRYKGIGVLLSSRDKLYYIKNRVNIVPLSFKAGTIPIPRSLAMGFLNKINNKRVNINKGNNSINIDVSMLPIAINSMSIKGSELLVNIPKIDLISKIDKFIDEESKTLGIAYNKNTTNTINGTGTKVQSTTKKENKIKNNGKGKSIKKVSDNRTSSQYSKEEKNVISIAQNAAKKIIRSPSYSYQSDLATAMSIYNKLSPREKEKVKAAILTKVDIKALMRIYMNKK